MESPLLGVGVATDGSGDPPVPGMVQANAVKQNTSKKPARLLSECLIFSSYVKAGKFFKLNKAISPAFTGANHKKIALRFLTNILWLA
jgi:hypothetical protein